jgi:hypothetical protein
MCASSWKDAEHKLFPAGCGFHPLFIEKIVCLASADAGSEAYCIVFVGSLLREDARKSAVEFFLFANMHCATGKVAGDMAEGEKGRTRQ